MIESNWSKGKELKQRLAQIISNYNLESFLQLVGDPCLFALVCRDNRATPNDSYRTLMMQEMIANGVLFQGLFYPTWSHKDSELDRISISFDRSCLIYKQAIDSGTTENFLIGRPIKPVFRKII
jgi:glutamate-1-semialdehyde 2,1-aminomutase